MAKPREGKKEPRRSGGSYYYVQGQRVNVSPREDLVAVSFRSREPADTLRAFSTARSAQPEPSDEFEEMQQGNLRIYRVTARAAGAQPALVSEKGSVRELVTIANDHGFFWGGHFKGRRDGMHFEVAAIK